MKFTERLEEIFGKEKYFKLIICLVSFFYLGLLVGVIFTLCGSNYFLLNYTNESLDSFQSFCESCGIKEYIDLIFLLIETNVFLYFIHRHFGLRNIIVSILSIIYSVISLYLNLPSYLITLVIFILIFISALTYKKGIVLNVLNYFIGLTIIFILEFLISYIKMGQINLNMTNEFSIIFNCYIDFLLILSSTYYLVVIIEERRTIKCLKRKQSETSHLVFSSSQNTRKKKQSTNIETTKKKSNFTFNLRFYLEQIMGFILILLFPIVTGKYVEYLFIYLTFVFTRAILGFNKSIHFEKESVCIFLALIIFWLITFFVPSFNINFTIAVCLGFLLAVFLHFSYKVNRLTLFMKVANKDRFATFYCILDGDLNDEYIKAISYKIGLDEIDTKILTLFMKGNKISYIAKTLNYDSITINRHLDDILIKFKTYDEN